MEENKIIEQIKTCETQLLNAMKRNDVEALDKLFHEKMLLNIPSGYTMSKMTDLESYRSGAFKLRDVQSSKQQINVVGDTAVVATTIKMRGTYMGGSINGNYRFMRVWKLNKSQWQVIGAGSVKMIL